MPSRRWTAGLLSAGLLTAGASTGLSPAGASPAAAGTRPTVGECRQLTATQVAAPTDTSGPIPCSTAHDDRVIGVPNLPTGVTWADLDTSTKVVHMGVTLCTPPWRSALGQSDRLRDRTAYSFVFFRPTRKQQASGARWLRCDLVLLHGPVAGAAAHRPRAGAARHHDPEDGPALPRRQAAPHDRLHLPAPLPGHRIVRRREQDVPGAEGDAADQPDPVSGVRADASRLLVHLPRRLRVEPPPRARGGLLHPDDLLRLRAGLTHPAHPPGLTHARPPRRRGRRGRGSRCASRSPRLPRR